MGHDLLKNGDSSPIYPIFEKLLIFSMSISMKWKGRIARVVIPDFPHPIIQRGKKFIDNSSK
jgi:hypothetical protein